MAERLVDQRFDSSGGEIRWAVRGEGEPVVLLHGTPFSSRVWRHVAEDLATTHRVYTWDMPGYGRSQRFEDQDVSLAAQGKVFTELLEHWGLREPAVVAHDFGGAVALRAHLLHGAAYRRLALVNVVAISPWGSPFFWLAHAHHAAFAQIPAFMHQAMVRAYLASASSVGLDDELLADLVEPWLGPVGQAAFYRQIAQADRRYTDDIEPLLGALDMPVLVAWGDQDALLPVDRARELAARIPGAHLEVIDGAGHLLQHDAPERLLGVLRGFGV
jgi:pimeloyl-ACP methyl ester carboxylesterase